MFANAGVWLLIALITVTTVGLSLCAIALYILANGEDN